jgi:hypothetical protein
LRALGPRKIAIQVLWVLTMAQAFLFPVGQAGAPRVHAGVLRFHKTVHWMPCSLYPILGKDSIFTVAGTNGHPTYDERLKLGPCVCSSGSALHALGVQQLPSFKTLFSFGAVLGAMPDRPAPKAVT